MPFYTYSVLVSFSPSIKPQIFFSLKPVCLPSALFLLVYLKAMFVTSVPSTNHLLTLHSIPITKVCFLGARSIQGYLFIDSHSLYSFLISTTVFLYLVSHLRPVFLLIFTVSKLFSCGPEKQRIQIEILFTLHKWHQRMSGTNGVSFVV